MREKGKIQAKLSYKLFEGGNKYDPLLEISPFPTLVQLTYFLCGTQHCVTVVDKWIFYSDITFALPLTCEELEYCFTNDNETKGVNGYNVVSKAIHFSPTDKNKCYVQK